MDAPHPVRVDRPANLHHSTVLEDAREHVALMVLGIQSIEVGLPEEPSHFPREAHDREATTPHFSRRARKKYLDDLRSKPDKTIAGGTFSETVQSIFAGAFEDPADALPLLRDLAPFADGAKKLSRLEAALKKGDVEIDATDELLDAFAVSTLDAFATAIAALATGRDASVPVSVKPLVPHLAQQVTRIKQALAQ